MISTYKAKRYCNQDISLIENYEKAIEDEKVIWHCHHRLETDKNLSSEKLIEKNLYFNRPASELIFLTPYEHHRLHSDGSNNPMYKKNYMDYMTDEAKVKKSKKQSIAMKKYWSEHDHPSLGGTSWLNGLTKETDIRVKQLGEKVSKTRKEKCSTGEIVVWNKGKKGVQQAWNKGKKGVQEASNKGTKLMTNGIIKKYVKPDEFNKYIEIGYHFVSKKCQNII